MRNPKLKNIKGYIEGYYGKLLSWDDRYQILNSLSSNNMNAYFYCPKEDLYQRFQWRINYPNSWLFEFKKFCKVAKRKNINVIAGISPGLDFNFKSLMNGNMTDYDILKSKFENLSKAGANYFSLLLDDIPNHINSGIDLKDEGYVHATLINKINSSNLLKTSLFATPRIYSDEQIKENKFYLKTFLKTLNKDVYLFYCGRHIVSKKYESKCKEIISKEKDKKIVYWDNYYANDYCPKRLFIGPWQNKNLINRSMINGTGHLNTDKLILEIVNKTAMSKNKVKTWKKILEKNNLPSQFFELKDFFYSPNFTNDRKLKFFKYKRKKLEDLEYLLWQWKSDLSKEWYPYLLNLKHDLQIMNNELSFNRILKTQTIPMQIKLSKKKEI